jgi:hypothetical protein
MSDGSIDVQSSENGGYAPQGSIEIAAPGALRAVTEKRKRRKNRPRSFCRLRRQTAHGLYVRRGQKDGKRDYKLSTETGQVQSLEQLEAIRSGRLDAGFVFNIPKAHSELEGLPVAMNRFELAAPTGHPLTKLKELRLRGLTDAAFIWFPRWGNPALYDQLMHECFRGGLKSPRIVQEGLDEATILSLVATGLGVAWVLGPVRKD